MTIVFGPAGLFAQDKPPAAKAAAAEAAYQTPTQAALLKKQVAALPPQRKGVTDVYAVGLAGWAAQDVFEQELAGALASLEKALPLRGRLQLVNSPDTAKAAPLATRQNFAAAIGAVARVMDKEEDVLLIFMTSHGAKDGFGLQLPAVTVKIRPTEVAAVLAKEGIKNRVMIVSACYSGIFVKPLANDDTIVITAADEKSPSFGCASGRQWTYFGDAFFHHSLKPGTDFQRAFHATRLLIEGWEKLERLAPSRPQAHFGEALTRKLQPLFEAAAVR